MSPTITTLKRKHEYTGCAIPWMIGDSLLRSPHDCRMDPDMKLIEYMSSGGGLPQIGRTSEHELMSRRQRRFLLFAGVAAVAWIVAIFV